MLLKKIILLILLLNGVATVFASEAKMTMQFQKANLVEVIREMARLEHLNVIIHPSVTGLITISLSDAEPKAAFDALLSSAGLVKQRMGNVWLIAPHDLLEKEWQSESHLRSLADEVKPLTSRFIRLRYAMAKEVAGLIQSEHTSLLSHRGHVQVDERTNALYIEETVDHLKAISHFMQQVDQPIQQVLIEARLVSLDTHFERELGLQFEERSSHQGASDQSISNHGRFETGSYRLSVARLAEESLLDVKLSALESAGHAELISNPSLFAANHEQASIEAGEEVPYQEVSDSGGTAVSFKKAVLGLKVTPFILPNQRVLLRLQVNQDRPSSRLVLGVPTISTQQMVTSVFVNSGHSIVLGGIYESDHQEGETRVPLISHLPILGWLFKQSHHLKVKRQLYIFVTPTIVGSLDHSHDQSNRPRD